MVGTDLLTNFMGELTEYPSKIMIHLALQLVQITNRTFVN